MTASGNTVTKTIPTMSTSQRSSTLKAMKSLSKGDANQRAPRSASSENVPLTRDNTNPAAIPIKMENNLTLPLKNSCAKATATIVTMPVSQSVRME